MLLIRKNGQTSNVIRAKLRRSDTGQGLTGLTISSSGLIISTIADNESTATNYTAAGTTIQIIVTLGTFAAPSASNCRFKEVDSTNQPGLYEFQFLDARFAVSAAKFLKIMVLGAANLLEKEINVQLTSADVDDGVHLGLTSLPNAAAAASGGLPTFGTGGGQINLDGSGNAYSYLNLIKGQTITCAAGVTIYPAVGAAYEIGVTSGGKISEVALTDTATNLLQINGTAQTAADVGALSIDCDNKAFSLLQGAGGRWIISTGTTSPITADRYYFAGWYLNQPYYLSVTLVTPMYVWQDSNGYWTISSTAPGAGLPSNYFKASASGGTVVGPYTGVGTTTGTPTVVAHGGSVLSGYQPDIVAAMTGAVVNLAADQVPLKKNTALNGYEFVMVSSTDHVTPTANLIVSGQVSLDGGAFANLTNSVSGIANGVYTVNLAAADVNGNNVMFRFTASGADATLIGHLTQ